MTGPPNSPTLLREVCDRLRALGDLPETPAARAEVEAALASKWWSVRVVATRTIARWGGKAAKAWLIGRALKAESEVAGGIYRHAVRQSLGDLEAQTSAEAVRPMLGPEDADWLLDLWFSGEPVAFGFQSHIMTQMPNAPIERRVAQEFARRRAEQRRLPLFWLARFRGGLSGRDELLRKLAPGRDEAGFLARQTIAWEARAREREAAATARAEAVPKKVAARRAARAAEEALDAEARRRAGRKGRR